MVVSVLLYFKIVTNKKYQNKINTKQNTFKNQNPQFGKMYFISYKD